MKEAIFSENTLVKWSDETTLQSQYAGTQKRTSLPHLVLLFMLKDLSALIVLNV